MTFSKFDTQSSIEETATFEPTAQDWVDFGEYCDERDAEVAGADEIYHNPRHAYTKALLSAVPIPDPTVKRERKALVGDVPSPIDPPAGSAFGHRISHPKYEESIGMDLGLVEIERDHWVARDPCCLTSEDWGRVRML